LLIPSCQTHMAANPISRFAPHFQFLTLRRAIWPPKSYPAPITTDAAGWNHFMRFVGNFQQNQFPPL
jgi:hypothetical protein